MWEREIGIIYITLRPKSEEGSHGGTTREDINFLGNIVSHAPYILFGQICVLAKNRNVAFRNNRS